MDSAQVLCCEQDLGAPKLSDFGLWQRWRAAPGLVVGLWFLGCSQ